MVRVGRQQPLSPNSVAVLVGLVFYKERAINIVTISAAWLGILAYLLLAHALTGMPENVIIWMGMAAIFALIVLGKRFPMFGLFLLMLITSFMRAAAVVGAGEWTLRMPHLDSC